MTTIIVLAVVLTVSIVTNAVLIGVLVGKTRQLKQSKRHYGWKEIY